ncbi:MAG TPA: amidase [Bryobacteraceae bacterium]|jgi:aspartyl-tRNA(Asn)/glutamyl-tRNA(Gln) amidotransferase subunit A
MAVPNEAFYASIGEIGAGLRSKQFSAVELTRAFCDRLERLGPRYNALALSMRAEALRQAQDVDGDLKIGRTRGPLQGIPYAVKDLLAVKGGPTTWGARPFAGQVFQEDAHVVQLLTKAGAILLGKLAMVELAGGGGYSSAAASLTGPGLNPWDRARWSGGSSSGSAAATAAGMATFTLGSETSGSILTPSAFCGVTGLRPTYGLVSRRGAMALSWTLDKIGPLCRSAEDCGLVLHAMAGGDSEDPGSAGRGFSYSPQYAIKPGEVTVGYAPVDFEGWAQPDARPTLQAGLAAMKSLGFKMKEIELPDFPYGDLVQVIIAGEAGSIFEDFVRSGRVDELADKEQIAGLKANLDLPAIEYLRAMRVRTQVQAALRELFSDIDLLLAPSRTGVAPKAAEPLDGGSPIFSRPSSRGLNGIIPAGNLAGLPAISLPCGLANGLPVAISLVARPFRENQMIAAGKAFQRQTDWHRRRPPAGD